jgi:nucleotide-binding universal stress UspA family protein
VIAGDDGSDDATAALNVAVVIAIATGAQLTLALAISGVPGLPRPGTAERDDLIAAVEGALRERAGQVLAGGAERARVAAAIDDPALLLLRLAESGAEPPLIAVGSRGLRLLERLRLGSTSTKVLHAAHCPVLVASTRAD